MANCSCPEPYRLLLSCEHAVNTVPPDYSGLFAGHREVLATHRGFDRYALEIAEHLARTFHAPLLVTKVTRLLVDCNRSRGSRNLFSPYSRPLGREERVRILTAWHTPHQEAVAGEAERIIATGAMAIHVAVHSFTPVLHGRVRTADLGILYNPARPGEKSLCARWLAELRRGAPDLRLRRNYPYLGKTNSLPTLLRERFPDAKYLGIELEINQGYVEAAGSSRLAGLIASSLRRTLRTLDCPARRQKI
jgi:predicted N-formylglutamate amidohydrolase